MIRILALAMLLAGCASRVTPALQPPHPDCPQPVATPAGVPAKPTAAQMAALEIRVELAREKERDRGDACAAAVDELSNWIRTRR